MKIRTYIIITLILLVGGFLYNQSMTEQVTEIPDQAIRLRILAHSDRAEDQWLKRKVRDAIIDEIKAWKERPTHMIEARQMIQDKLPDFQHTAQKTLQQYGATQTVAVDFGQVPFPTKLYGDQIYPAGEYEALRITLGEGKGDNWWCVLFPPLCFIDMSNGDAIAEQSEAQRLSASISEQTSTSDTQQEAPMQVRFFLLDKGMELLEKGF